MGLLGSSCRSATTVFAHPWRSSPREQGVARFDASHDAVSGLLESSFDVLTTPELLTMLERLEAETRRLPVPGHAVMNQLATPLHHLRQRPGVRLR